MGVKFTPGPWERWGTAVYFPENKGGIDLVNLPDAEANADLISAAPDMYEVLKKAKKALREAVPYMQTDESGQGPDCTNLFQAIIDADFILAKAAGEK